MSHWYCNPSRVQFQLFSLVTQITIFTLRSTKITHGKDFFLQ